MDFYQKNLQKIGGRRGERGYFMYPGSGCGSLETIGSLERNNFNDIQKEKIVYRWDFNHEHWLAILDRMHMTHGGSGGPTRGQGSPTRGQGCLTSAV